MRVRAAVALVLVSSVCAASDVMVISGTAGDFITVGKAEVFTDVRLTSGFGEASFDMPRKLTNMAASFVAPAKQKLQVGTYDFATRLPF